jgi:hypothetical protein
MSRVRIYAFDVEIHLCVERISLVCKISGLFVRVWAGGEGGKCATCLVLCWFIRSARESEVRKWYGASRGVKCNVRSRSVGMRFI